MQRFSLYGREHAACCSSLMGEHARVGAGACFLAGEHVSLGAGACRGCLCGREHTGVAPLLWGSMRGERSLPTMGLGAMGLTHHSDLRSSPSPAT